MHGSVVCPALSGADDERQWKGEEGCAKVKPKRRYYPRQPLLGDSLQPFHPVILQSCFDAAQGPSSTWPDQP